MINIKEYLLIDAVESHNLIKKRGYKYFTVNDTNIKETKRRNGEYYTINISLLSEEEKIKKVIKKVLRKVLRSNRILSIGLGNEDIMADSFGPLTTSKIIPSNCYNDFLTLPKVAIFNPKITSKTGINSYKLIKMVVSDLKPKLILIIDSCITKDINNIGHIIEINTAGIIRRDAIYNNKDITKETFNIPVIAILTPTIVNINNELYTSPYIKDIVTKISNIVSNSINEILF